MTMMPTSTEDNGAEKTARLGVDDPLLQELWRTKAALNAAAGYSVERLLEQANRFDLDATLDRLRQRNSH